MKFEYVENVLLDEYEINSLIKFHRTNYINPTSYEVKSLIRKGLVGYFDYSHYLTERGENMVLDLNSFIEIENLRLSLPSENA